MNAYAATPEAFPALVLNADFRPLSYYPLSLWSWQESVKAVFLERVNIVSEYDRFVLPVTRRILSDLSDLGVPAILFGVGTGELLGQMATSGADVIGVDWRVPLDRARARVGPGRAVQGNLDPALCLSPWHVVAEGVREVLTAAGSDPGHVFNLGHGVLPETDPEILAAVVELVHAEGRAGVVT